MNGNAKSISKLTLKALADDDTDTIGSTFTNVRLVLWPYEAEMFNNPQFL